MEQQSSVSRIVDYPDKPVTLFKQLIQAAQNQQKPDEVLYMNLATIDEEFGVLNRTVVYRGLSDDDCIIYITQRFTRNYQNLAANARCSITLFFPQLQLATQDTQAMTWQVRLIGAVAEELPDPHLDAWWDKERLPAKIRDIVFLCGKPIDYDELRAKHDDFLKEHLASGQPLQRPKTL